MTTPFPCEYSGLSVKGGIKNPAGSIDRVQCVNPQDTDKRYQHGLPPEGQYPAFTDGLVTPSLTDISQGYQGSRCPSLITPDLAASCNGELVAAYSTSSLNSSPDQHWSCPSSASTPISSRPKSIVYPEDGQYYLSETSPTPACHPKRQEQSLSVEGGSSSDSGSDDGGFYSNNTSFSTSGDCSINNTDNGPFLQVNEYSAKAQIELQDLQSSYCNIPGYGSSAQDAGPLCFGTDMVTGPSGLVNFRSIDFSPTTLATETVGPQDVLPSSVAPISSLPSLDPVFQYHPCNATNPDDTAEYAPKIEVRDCRPSQLVNRKKQRQRSKYRGVNANKNVKSYVEGDDKRCKHCDQKCNRKEHLKRHEHAKHNPKPVSYPCAFEECKDKKTNERKRIQSRNDNFKAHYYNTHFSYGQRESTGKNIRYSMKVSLEKGLREKDKRWGMMLAGNMKWDHIEKGFLNVWKMIGYSIRETREIKVKDIIPEWDGPKDACLATLDPRWTGLESGTLSYEQAMSIGVNMTETEAQGVLGVTLAETEEMGIKQIDPRWICLENGSMSGDDAQKLGVKDQWDALKVRRKALI
ncbi:hypothetical protein ACLMJK_002491 [Lecanora helva]